MSEAIFANRDSLQEAGFTGFMSIRALRECNLECVPGRIGDIGVYVVLSMHETVPPFVEKSTGAYFKGRDPNVALNVLISNWVSGTPVVYIGKAGKKGSPATLRSRLRQYLHFGAGKAVGHWGGRMIWQIPTSENLIICWKRVENVEPRNAERELIQIFKKDYGRRPFANLKD